MLTRFKGGNVYDPTQGLTGQQHDLWAENGRFVVPSKVQAHAADQTIDLTGLVVMAGGIDLHTHIGGGKLTIARALLPERMQRDAVKRDAELRSGTGGFAPSCFETGYRYAELGYTACFEPAMLPSGARLTHLEMADIPIIDHGAYVLMGNEDFLLQKIAAKADPREIADLVAWTMQASGALAVKVVNPAGIDAFKFGQRRLNVDQAHPQYGVTPRDVVASLSAALHDLGVPHPLHVHCSNLGIPGNWESTIQTALAADGRPIHLTHIQFHSYGQDGPKKFSSQAAAIAEFVNQHPNVSIDIGQVIFGQTVTVSADIMHQFEAHDRARPRKWVCSSIEAQSGCGVVPFKYRDTNYVHALQWAIGLELLLLVEDPWRMFLTTDHPNGGPFTSYPHLIRMLMDRTFREEQLLRINPEAAAVSNLRGLTREYSLEEIVIMTRAAPSRILGLSSLGHLQAGAHADVVAYRPHRDFERMFAKPAWVFRRGEAVVQEGRLIGTPTGHCHRVLPSFDNQILPEMDNYLKQHLGVRLSNYAMSSDELSEMVQGNVEVHPCQTPQS